MRTPIRAAFAGDCARARGAASRLTRTHLRSITESPVGARRQRPTHGADRILRPRPSLQRQVAHRPLRRPDWSTPNRKAPAGATNRMSHRDTKRDDRRVRDIDLKTLRLFVAVADCRSMARAAEQEHIEPSAISKRIAQLEDDLGVELLLRGRRGVQTTPAGLALLEHARTVLFTLDRIAADAASFTGGVEGHVRLIATASAIAEALLDH